MKCGCVKMGQMISQSVIDEAIRVSREWASPSGITLFASYARGDRFSKSRARKAAKPEVDKEFLVC